MADRLFEIASELGKFVPPEVSASWVFDVVLQVSDLLQLDMVQLDMVQLDMVQLDMMNFLHIFSSLTDTYV